MNVGDLDAVNLNQVRLAGPRYTPGLNHDAPNVEIEALARALAFLGTHPSHRAYIRTLKQVVDDGIRWLPKPIERAFGRRKFTPAQVAGTLQRLSDAGPDSYPDASAKLRRSVTAVERTLSRLSRELDQQELDAETDEHRRQARNAQGELRRVFRPIMEAREFLDSPAFSLLTNNAMLLLGEWGTGKTHSLCDVTEQRMREGLPTLLCLAHGLPAQRNPLQGVCDATRLAATPYELLRGLDRLGKSAGCRTLLIIDGINEGDREAWFKSLPSIVRAVRRFRHVGLVLSCRQPFESLILPDSTKGSFVTLEHLGFSEIEVDAQVAFFTHYEIPPPQVPILTPEFSRPLFLKMLCESLTNRARRHKSAYLRDIASGQKGMTLLLEDFSKALGKSIERDFSLPALTCWRLLKGDALTPGGPFIGMAPAMALAQREYIRRDECLELIKSFTGCISSDKCEDFLRRLLVDGLLSESVEWPDRQPVPVIQFPYQRFGDHLIARYLLERHLDTVSSGAIRRCFYSNRPLGKIFDLMPSRLSYRNPGVASAIMLEFPERVKRAPVPHDERELVVYLPRSKQLAAPLRDVFLDGLYWRPAESFTEATDRILEFYLARSHEWTKRAVLEVLVSLATRAGHPYAAERLYRRIQSQDVPDRDLFWSEFLRSIYRDSAIFRLIEWIEASGEARCEAAVADNCVTLLSLVLTTTRRALRDRATRALYMLGLRQPSTLFDHTVASLDFNDPYVPERMLAASYGVVMSTWADPDGGPVRSALPAFARALVKRMLLPRGRSRTAHILMQDYALGIVELARRLFPRCVPKAQLGYLERPLTAIRSPFPAPSKIDREAAEAVNSAIHMDFGNYTIGRLVSGRQNYDFDHHDYDAVRLQLLWRIEKLGYSDERFREVDSEIARLGDRRQSADPSKVDRYGKKYSWIAFFEMYGVRYNGGLLGEWHNDRPSDADIDPSFPAEPPAWIPPLSGVFDNSPPEPREWLAGGATPDYNALLQRQDPAIAPSSWVLLEGWLEERHPSDKRRIFTFLWARLVDPASQSDLLSTFLRQDYPGNAQIPQPVEDYYTFVGEVPWSRRYGVALRDGGGTPRRHLEPAFCCYTEFGPVGISVEVPVSRLGWESYHSPTNQAGTIYFPAPMLCDSLALVKHSRSVNLYDGSGRQATLFTRAVLDQSGVDCHFLYVRSDLLDKYLQETKQSLIWFIWGEREFETDFLHQHRTEWSAIFEQHQNIHRRAFVWDREQLRPLATPAHVGSGR